MCLLTSIVSTHCPNNTAGITQFWVLPCGSLKEGNEFTIDAATRLVTAITYNPDITDPKWARIKPQTDTAFANNAGTRNGNSRNTAQTISFVLDDVSCETIKNAEDLMNCCCQVAIVKYGNGKYFLYGVGYDSTTQTITVKGLKSGENSWNSGADPAADTNEIVIALTANIPNLPICVDSALIASLPTY